MVKYKKLFQSTQYRRDYRRMKKRVRSMKSLLELTARLSTGKLRPKDRDHALRGEYYGCRGCHISGDWILVYQIEGEYLILLRTGTHSDIFKKKY